MERKNITLEEFMEGIHLPDEGKKTVAGTICTPEEYARLKELFYRDEEGFFREIEEREEKRETAEEVFLWFYVRLAAELYEDFKADGIEDNVYFDTFLDITIWHKYCLRVKGIPGLVETRWLTLPLKRKIYRLGRLQFEPGATEEGTPVLHVHIPEGEPLKQEACLDSFDRASEFFKGQYHLCDCETWLLSPNLLKILDENSNIRKFQELFEIQKIVYPYRQAESRVFGYVSEDVESYPADTRLQTALKEYLKKYGDPGIGYGVRYI